MKEVPLRLCSLSQYDTTVKFSIRCVEYVKICFTVESCQMYMKHMNLVYTKSHCEVKVVKIGLASPMTVLFRQLGEWPVIFGNVTTAMCILSLFTHPILSNIFIKMLTYVKVQKFTAHTSVYCQLSIELY